MTAAVADFVGSAVLVADTVTVCIEAVGGVAVKTPEAEIMPAVGGVMDQVTVVVVEPVTLAKNV